MDFPTLGLNFDLNQLVEGMQRLARTKAEFIATGQAADRAGDQAQAAGRQMTEASLAAEAAAFRAARSHKSEEDAIRSKMRQVRDLERVLRDIQRVERLQQQVEAPQHFDMQQAQLGMRLNRQRAQEAIALSKQMSAAERERLKEQMAAEREAMQAAQQAQRVAQQTLSFKMRMTQQQAAEVARASELERRSWERVAAAITIAANETVRARQQDAEARVRITQAEIAQNRQSSLTQESLTREAMLVDRLTKELNELGQARAAQARQSAPPGANADLIGRAAATSVNSTGDQARRSLESRRALLAEQQAREGARRGILAYVAALFGLGSAYDQTGRKQNAFSGGFYSLGRIMREARLRAFDLRFALAAVFGAITLGPLAEMADQMVALESRTRLYAARAGDVPQILEETYQVAQRARAPLEGVATLYTRLAPLADTLGRSQKQLLGVVETVSKAFTIGGAAASEARAASQQFAQALASNRFGGDELRSVAENAPALLAAIADGVNQINPALNLNAATFIKWAQKGNATADIMVQALEKAKGRIDQMFASTTPTIGQATVTIQNGLQRLIDEVDRRSGEAGMRLSTNIAMGLRDFSEFLTRESTIQGVTAAITGLRVVFESLGTAAGMLVTYFPALVTGLVAFTAAANAALITSTLNGVMRAMAPIFAAATLQITGAGGGLALFSGAATAAAGAAARLGVAIRSLGALMAGPFGMAIALTSAVAGLSYMKSQANEGAESLSKMSDATQTSATALQRAVSWLETYGGSSDESSRRVEALNKQINQMIGLTDDQTKGLDQAGQAALRRAAMERDLTVALLRRAAAEQIALQASLNRSATIKEADAWAGESTANSPLPRLWFEKSRDQLRQDAASQRASASFERSLANSLDPQALMRQADALAGTAIDLLAIPDGTGGGGGGTEDASGKGKGMAGAINSIARLRAEVRGLNEQIDALSVNPLSDIAARIIAAGREAAAARTAGKGASFQDQAQQLAMLKEEASIRLDLTRALVEQQRAAQNAGQTDYYGAMYDADARAKMEAYFASGDRSARAYARALSAQANATLQAQKEQANLQIAQEYGVTSVSEIAQAYRTALSAAGLLTAETAAYADALQAQAQSTYNAQAAALELAEARKRLQQSGEARLARRQEIDDLNEYAQALRAGAVAVDEYNRRKQTREALQTEGPLPSTGFDVLDRVLSTIQALQVANDVAAKSAASYNVALGERTLEMEEQLRLATLTTRQRQIEAEAIALARAGGRSAANDNDRQNASNIINQAQRTDLKISVQDSIRSAFIDTGKLDFRPLGDALAKTVRQKLYDALIAKPINIAVNAAVDLVSKGMDHIVGSFLNMAGPWGQAAGAALAVASMVLGKERISDNRDYYQTAEETQARQGTGTVLGSLKEQSQSIRNALEIAASFQNRTLEYSNGMLMALRNIDNNIGSLTGLLGRQLGVGGAFDTSGLGLGTSTKGPSGLLQRLMPLAWIAPALFGKTTTTNLMDQGLQFNAQSLAAILNGGISGSTYQDIESNTKKKFLGITYSNKTSYTTQRGALDAEIATQIGLVIRSLREGAVEAANVLGITGADALLNSMMINIGRISFKDMTSAQIQEQLNAVFSSIGDTMAARLVPAVAQFQKAGEGALETLVRLARQYQVVDVTLASIGAAFGAVGLESLAARERLINLAGGLDQFTSQAQFFADNFLSEQDRLAPAQRAVEAEMKRLGLTGITTRDQFKRLVQGLDLSTESGATMYAALMNLAPAFAVVTEGADKVQERLMRIFEFAQGLLTSSLSPLSPQQQLDIQRSEYESLLARAQAGDVRALEKLTDASSEYLTAAQKFFAASPEYEQIFNRVYQELIALSGIEVQDPVITTLETEFQRLIDAINAGFDLVAGDWRSELPDSPVATPTNDNVPPPSQSWQDWQTGVPALYERVGDGLAAVNEQLARQTEAIVASQQQGFSHVVDGMHDAPALFSAYDGGSVRQNVR